MTQERELARATNVAEPPASRDVDLAPGRTSASARLRAPAHPLISGLIQRKAERDANGVAAGADAAIADAAATSGSALPQAILRKFEASLGADLSNVRVHTGGESQSAAHAVGAKAYTIGQDIHFGAGHYDPSSAAGEHLLAHEVAHTVQQQGGAASRQNKLEVSTPFDAAEHEADRAADAMVRGAAFAVSAGTASVARDVDRNPLTGEPTLPRPIYWADQMIDQDITGAWSGKPQFNVVAIGDLSPKGAEWTGRVERLKTAFTQAWATQQGSWNAAVPAFAEYKQASQDAQNKGLADFGGTGSDIDVDADMADMGGKTTVSEAFVKDDNKVEAGAKTFDASKVNPELRRQILDQKQGVRDAQAACDKSERGIDTARDNLDSAHKSLENAVGTLAVAKDAKNIAQLNTQIDAYKKCSEVIGSALGSMTKAKGDTGGAVEGGAAALQLVNTFAWESAIRNIESQIQVLQGGAMATDIQNADNMAAIAKNQLNIAKRGVTDAIDDYKSKCAAVKKADAVLAASLEKATTQSGGSAQTAARVRVAVEALPLMQLTLQKIQALLAKCVVVAETEDARCGGGLAANSQDFVTHAGILSSWKNTMQQSAQTWQKRIALAQKLVAQAH